MLYGSGKEKIEFHYANSRGMQIKKVHRFEGVIPNLERRYRETDSGAVREELTQIPEQPGLPGLRRHAPQHGCPACVCQRPAAAGNLGDVRRACPRVL